VTTCLDNNLLFIGIYKNGGAQHRRFLLFLFRKFEGPQVGKSESKKCTKT